MARKANDGSEWTNQMMVNRRNASLAAKGQDSAVKPDGMMDDPTAQPSQGDIMSDPKAMQMVDQLKQMGYTGEDVERAMGGAEEQQEQPQSSTGMASTKAAPLQIPGMG